MIPVMYRQERKQSMVSTFAVCLSGAGLPLGFFHDWPNLFPKVPKNAPKVANIFFQKWPEYSHFLYLNRTENRNKHNAELQLAKVTG